jgi:hypothetical protein
MDGLLILITLLPTIKVGAWREFHAPILKTTQSPRRELTFVLGTGFGFQVKLSSIEIFLYLDFCHFG